MNECKVSVIIPVYNRENYIERCLNSIIAQTFPDWEAICVDDGSTDHSGVILDQFSKKDRRIRVIHQKNSGVSHARNVALSYSGAPYISMVDSDDCLEPDALFQMVKAAELSHADIVIVGTKSKKHKRDYCSPPFLSNGYHAVQPSQFLSLCPAPWAKLFKRDIIEKNKLLFQENLTIGEDAVFVASYWCLAKTCYALSEPLYTVEKSDNSLTLSFRDGVLPYSVYVDTLKLAKIIFDNTIEYVEVEHKNKWISALFEFFLRERDFVFDYVVCSQEQFNSLHGIEKEHYHFFSKKITFINRCCIVIPHNAMWIRGRIFRLLGKIKRFLIKLLKLKVIT